ncbi:MAG: hypothetical protein R2755_01730 [Acidimicrobiales bacterium]
MAGAAEARPGDGGGVILQAVTCGRWSDVPANATQGMEEDDTGGLYTQWGPFDPQRVQPLALEHLVDCTPLDGVAFRLSGTEYGNGLKGVTNADGTPYYPPEATTVPPRLTGADGPGTLAVAPTELTAPQRSALTDGRGLWVQAAGFSGQFANLRCHEDRYNADNLEVIRLLSGTPGPGAACVLYVIGAVALPTQVTPPPPVITTPPVVTMPPLVAPPPAPPAVVAPAPVEDPVVAPLPTAVPSSEVVFDTDPPPAAPAPQPNAPDAVVLAPGGTVLPDATTSGPVVDRGAADGSATAAPDLAERPPSTVAPVVVALSPAPPTPTVTVSTTTPGSVGEQDGATRTVTTEPYLIEQPVEGSEEAMAAVGGTGGGAGGLDPAAAATLGAVFLAGLGLTVLAARRPL